MGKRPGSWVGRLGQTGSAVLVAWALARTPCAAGQTVRILYPPDQVIVGGAGQVHVVIEASAAEQATVRVQLDGKATPPAQAAAAGADRVIVHFRLQLAHGRNGIDVAWREPDGREVRESREVFFFFPLAVDKHIPAGFRRLPFHQEGTAAACAGCHRLRSAPEDRLPAAPERSTCFACHRGLTQYRNVHGPAAKWACTTCHDSTSSPAAYGTPAPVVRDLCFRCHEDMKEYLYGHKYQHGPTTTGICIICHNPHATDHPYWLKKAPWDLCTTCHTEKASGRHVIAWGPTGNTHPTRGKPDPMRPERELACNSCHNPHAAPSRYLWNFGVTRWVDLCQTCHQK